MPLSPLIQGQGLARGQGLHEDAIDLLLALPYLTREVLVQSHGLPGDLGQDPDPGQDLHLEGE